MGITKPTRFPQMICGQKQIASTHQKAAYKYRNLQ